MKLALLPLALLACGTWSSAADSVMTIRPVQVISQAEIPAGAPEEARTVVFNKGFTIGYLIEGSDIIGLDKESLVIEHILVPGGKDIAMKRNGKPNYEFGSFPKVSDDGKYAFFQLESEEHVFGKAESLDVQGSITVHTATQLVTVLSKPHGLAGEEAETLDAFTVTFGPGKDPAIPRFLEDEYKTKSTIVVKGPLASIVEIRLVVGGKDIEEESYSTSESEPRTYFFPKVEAGAPGALRIKYWKDLKEVVVPIGKK